LTTIRVRANPAGTGEYVIYADPQDPPTPWLGQTADGSYMGWLPERDVADWPKFDLTVPELVREVARRRLRHPTGTTSASPR
jgi:hypothetical protein